MLRSSSRGFTITTLLGSIGATSMALSLSIPDVSVEDLTRDEAESPLTVRFFTTHYQGEDLVTLRENVSASLRDTPFAVSMMTVRHDTGHLAIGLWSPEAVPLERAHLALSSALGKDGVSVQRLGETPLRSREH